MSFQLTPEESSVYSVLFSQLDPAKKGSVGSGACVEFFRKSGLPDEVLGKIWQQANASGTGALDPKEFSIAMKLISLAQNGKEPLLSNISTPGLPLPAFQDRPQSKAPLVITPEERQKFQALFNAQQTNNFVEGDKAKAIFMNSKLPVDTLMGVWNLCDIDNDGKLSLKEFTIGMFLISSLLNNKIQTLPATLPPSLLQSFQATTPASLPPPLVTPASASLPPPLAPPTSISSWAITPEERARFSNIFDQQDVRQQGGLSGIELRDFLMRTNLPQEVLGQVWQLSDIGAKGYLTRDEFCITLKLLNRALAGLDLPQVLPPELQPQASSLGGAAASHAIPGVSPADLAAYGAEGALLIMEKRKQLEAEEKAAKELEGKIELFQQDVDELRKRRATLEEELREKQAESSMERQRLEDLQQQVDQTTSIARNLQMVVDQQGIEISEKKAVLAQHEAKVKSLQQDKVKISETVSKEQAKIQNQLLNLQHSVSQLRNQMSEVENQKKKIQQIIANQSDAIERVKAGEEVGEIDTTAAFVSKPTISTYGPDSPRSFATFDDGFGSGSGSMAATPTSIHGGGFAAFDDDPFGNPPPHTGNSRPTSSFAGFDDDGFGSAFSSAPAPATKTTAALPSKPPTITSSFAAFDDDPFGTGSQGSPFGESFDDAFRQSPLHSAPPKDPRQKNPPSSSSPFDNDFAFFTTPAPAAAPKLSASSAANPKLAKLIPELRLMGFQQDEKVLVDALARYDYNVEKTTNFLLDQK